MSVSYLFTLLSFCAVFTSLSAGFPGSVEPIEDLESDEVRAAAEEAVCLLNEESNSEFKTVLVKVVGGTVQIVAGKKYVLSLLVGTSTGCKKEDTSENCPVCRESLATWIATIIYHPWLPSTYEVTDLVEAPKEDHSPSNPGAPRPLVDLDSQYILNAAQVAVTDLNKMSNSLYKMVLVQVLQGTVQVVNGVRYSLIIQVGMSQCFNDGEMVVTVGQCPVADPNNVETWEAVVWQDPSYPDQYKLISLHKLPLCCDCTT